LSSCLAVSYNRDMDEALSKMARALGRRGGLARARRLPGTRRAEIARQGGQARAESRRAAEAIRRNFDYLDAIDRLRPAPPVRPKHTATRRLPGIYGAGRR
jgi:hypothetical protein